MQPKRISLGFWGLCFWIIANSAWAQADLNKGISWLNAQQQGNGSYSLATDTALPEQATSEVLSAFYKLSEPGSAAQDQAYAYLNQAADIDTELIARKIIAGAQRNATDQALVTLLKARQNGDGGFGAYQGHTSHSLDTAWALKALALAGHALSNEASNALAWLIGGQQSGGNWANNVDGDDFILTAQATDAVWHYRHSFNIQNILDNARWWLMNRQSAGQWDNTHKTAWALRAVLPGLSDTSSVQNAIDSLSATQNVNGSWENDVYLTALVLQVLSTTGGASPNPDHGTVSGTVLDDETGLPLSNVAVQLQNATLSRITDAQGQFSFTHLSAGNERLSIEVTGYRSLSAPLNLQPGQKLDLGQLRLIKGAGTDVTITGIARYTDASNGVSVAANATITAGSLQAKTNSQGVYTLTGIPAGQIDLSATYSNYPAIQTSITAKAGETISLDLMFKAATTIGTSIKFIVTNGDTGNPISGAMIGLNPTGTRVNVSTNSQGVATHQNALVEGKNFFEIYRGGYEVALIKIDLKGWQGVIEVPVSLKPVSTLNTAVLSGTVTDDETGFPLAGVTVKVPSKGLETQTDSQGEYAFGTFLNRNDIVFEKAGYETATFNINADSGWRTVFNVALKAQTGVLPESNLKVTVLDRSTGLPIEKAAIILTGATSTSIQTDAAGTAAVSPLSLGDTQVQIEAAGYQSVFAIFTVKPGQSYELPAELLQETNAMPSVYGIVVDAVTRQPVSGATVSLTGAHIADTTTDTKGYYEFTDVSIGNVVLKVQHTNYETKEYELSVQNSLEVGIIMAPLWVGVDNSESEWQVFGTIVDAATVEPISGAEILLQEVVVGSAVLAEQTGYSQITGDFLFDGLKGKNARLMITMPGYDTAVVPFTREKSTSQSLGAIKLTRSYNAALPDLALKNPDRSALVLDPNTFEASGTVSVTVGNNSNYDAGAFNIIVFDDINHNGVWDDAGDILLAKKRITSLAQQVEQQVTFTIDQATLSFRDAPIYIMADSDLEVIENIEGNNTLRVSVPCSGAGGAGIKDVAVCIDASGSVSSLYNLEMEGAIKAVENPNIIPHDGSIRFSLDTPPLRSASPPLHPATILTPATLPDLLNNLKTKSANGGDSSGSQCALEFSKYLNTLVPPSTSKTLILVGDGYWETISTVQMDLPQTIANGIDRIDVIGVGSVDVPTLEENAWPKPVNTLHGGKVTLANTSAEVAAAMARALGDAVKSVDLTLGKFRIIDKGAGQPVKLIARIGNAGTLSQAATVRFYQTAALLGEVSIGALNTGEYADVTLDNVNLISGDFVEAVVDEDRINAECNINNNRQQIPIAAANQLGQIHVSTDQVSYLPDTPVSLTALIQNSGRFSAKFKARLSILDSNGDEVIAFDEADLGNVASNGSTSHNEGWNTGRIHAGSYTLYGELLTPDGNVIDEDRANFTILAVAAGELYAALRVATDRMTYEPHDQVMLDSLARNLSVNTHVEGAYVDLVVHDPNQSQIHTHTETLGQLAANGLKTFEVSQKLQNAPIGTYTVQGTLKDKNNMVLAMAGTTYDVSVKTLPAGLVGSVIVAQTAIYTGDAQTRTDALTNTGNVALDNLNVARVLIRDSDGAELGRVENMISLAVGGDQQWANTPVATGALIPGSYTVAILIEDSVSPGTWDTLAAAGFTVLAQQGQQNVQTIPSLSPAAILLLLLLMLGIAAHRQKTVNNHGFKGEK